MLECTELRATEVGTVCPHCDEVNLGWCVDPRGKIDTCEFCDKEYKVYMDADIDYY